MDDGVNSQISLVNKNITCISAMDDGILEAIEAVQRKWDAMY